MDWDAAKALVERAERVVVLTHISPDGDAFGSMLGLGHMLAGQGKAITLVVDEGMVASFRFLPGADLVRGDLDGLQADLAIAVDCSDEKRMGKAGEAVRALGLPLINLDHHRTNTLFGTANLVDAATVASAEGVLDWVSKLGWPLTPEAAQCLLCGLVTDTQCFRTDNVTSVTLGKAQRLMESGGSLATIVQHTVSRVPSAAIRLWALVMPTARLEDHVAWIKVSQAARQQAGLLAGERDGDLVNLLLQAEDVRVSCVFREEKTGEIDLSMRAAPGFDVSQIALALGGGGHLRAAGARLAGTLDEVEAQVVPLLKAAARQGEVGHQRA